MSGLWEWVISFWVEVLVKSSWGTSLTGRFNGDMEFCFLELNS